MQPLPVSTILESAAALMNDSGRAVYTDEEQLPYFNIAYDDLKLLTASYGIPINNITTPSSILIAAGVTDIGGPTGPPLPTDLIDIIGLMERTSGTSNQFLPMRRVGFLPQGQTQTAYLGIWSWQNQVINFIGATGDIEVRMNYLASNLGEVVNEDTLIRMNNCKNFLQYRTAALCAEFIGENQTRAESLNSMAQASGDAMLNIAIRSQQGIVTRRRVTNIRGKNGRWR